MQNPTDATWTIFRVLRSDPPGRATSGERRRTFSAGLNQAEELWRASGLVTHEVAPILLFYGLTQAARAIQAAGIDGPRWQAVPSHGLTLKDPQVPGSTTPRISDIIVTARPGRQGFCQQFAELTGSAAPPEECSLADILAQLPQHEQLLLEESSHPRPLRLHDQTLYRSLSSTPSSQVVLQVGPLPDHLVHFDVGPDGRKRGRPLTPEEVAKWLSDYPSLQRAGVPDDVSGPDRIAIDSPHAGYAIELTWHLDEPVPWGRSADWFETVADVVSYRGAGVASSGIALPAVGTPPTVLMPLTSWWIALFATSMLARYHPTTWRELTDVDTCRDAVPLMTFLETASREVPVLLIQTLSS